MILRSWSRAVATVAAGAMLAAQLTVPAAPALACSPGDVVGSGTEVLWQLGGAYTAGSLASTDGPLYVAKGSGVQVFEATSGLAPQGVADLGGRVAAVESSGTLAFAVGAFGGIKAIEASDPADPREVSEFLPFGDSYDIALDRPAALAFITTSNHGMKAVDVSDVMDLHYHDYLGPSGGTYKQLAYDAGSLAVRLDREGLADKVEFVQVAEGGYMTRKGAFTTGGDVSAVALKGKVAYAGVPGVGVEVIDFTTPTAPVRSALVTEGVGNVADLAISGDRLVVASPDGDRSLSIADPKHPNDPLDIRMKGGGSSWLAFNGDRCVFGGDGFRLVARSGSDFLPQDGYGQLPRTANDLVFDGRYVYAACGEENLVVVDTNDPTDTLYDSFSVSTDTSLVAKVGSEVFVGGGNQVLPWNVADPSAPVAGTSTSVEGELMRLRTDEASGVAYAVGTAGVAVVKSTAGVASVLATFAPDSAVVVNDIDFKTVGEKKYAFLAVEAAGDDGRVEVWDVTDPAAAAKVTEFWTIGAARSLRVSGDELFIGTSMKLQRADITDPTAADITGAYLYFGEPIEAVAPAADGIVWVSMASGVYAVDVTDLWNPYAVAQWNGGAGAARGLAVADGVAYVAARDAGLVALRSLATRTAGINRFETAVELVRSQFTTADAVVLTTGRSFADAVCGAPLAQALGAPMLMTERTAVPALVIDEIRRLGAKKIYILGGTGAVSDSVVTQLKSEFSLTDADIVRIAGANRYETSANIARKLAEIKGYTVAGATKDVGEVFVANGENFPDALAASGVAAKVGVPILLVTPQWLPAATSDVITDLKWPRAVVIGGRGAVSDGVYTAVRGKDRWYGNDRYATATDIARKAIRDRGLRIDEVMVATGNDFPDALAAGVIAAKTRQPLLLTGTYLPTATSDFLAANRMAINDVTLVGGTGAVTSEAATAISAVLH